MSTDTTSPAAAASGHSDVHPPSAAFDIKPLMAAYMACNMAMMAFVSVIGPMARVLKLAAWQAGAVITIGGILWMLLARSWGAASDRRGRRTVLLAGVGGFTISYWGMCALLIVAMAVLPSAWLVFAGLIVTRGAVGAFYAAIPSVSQAMVADHLPPGRRAAAMASLGAANAVGLVAGPALAAGLSPFGLSLPLYITAILPPIAFALLWKTLPRTVPASGTRAPALRLSDPRLRRPMTVAFVATSCVAIAQITVGFFAIDRLGLPPASAARAAGLALTLVGVALIMVQIAVRRLGWSTQRLIKVGALVGAVGFGSVALAQTSWMLAASFVVAAAGLGWVFPAFAAMASNAVQAHEQGAAAGSVGAAQGLGLVLGPMLGTLLYEAGPGVPYLLAGVMLVLVALWPQRIVQASKGD